MEILDIAYWCIAQCNKLKAENERNKSYIYNLSVTTAICVSRIFAKNGKLPTYDELFGKQEINNNLIKSRRDVEEHLLAKKKRKEEKINGA